MKSSLSCILTSLLLAFCAIDVRGAEETDQHALPAEWVAAWQEPPLSDRPLQIVHGIDARYALPDGVDQMVPGGAAAAGEPRGMRHYVDYGLGGIVCNVAFDKYLRSEEHWHDARRRSPAMREAGHGRLAVRRGGLPQRRSRRTGAG